MNYKSLHGELELSDRQFAMLSRKRKEILVEKENNENQSPTPSCAITSRRSRSRRFRPVLKPKSANSQPVNDEEKKQKVEVQKCVSPKSPEGNPSPTHHAPCSGLTVKIIGHECRTEERFFASSKKFVIYALQSRVQGAEQRVKKRYSDFVDLFAAISSMWDSEKRNRDDMPPMPELPASQGGVLSWSSNPMGEEFVVKRQEALNSWLKEIVWNLDYWCEGVSDKVLDFLSITEEVKEAQSKSKAERRKRRKVNYDLAAEMESYW